MKKKVGELYDKPIVVGNPNEFTKDEIPLNELKQGTNQYLYFSIEYTNIDAFIDVGGFVLLQSQVFKVEDPSNGSIKIEIRVTGNDIENEIWKMKAVVLDPSLKINAKTTIVDNIKDTLKTYGYNSITDIPGVTPITEEEFYTI